MTPQHRPKREGPLVHYFTMREATYIEKNWQEKTDRELAEALGLRPKQIMNFRARNGLKGKKGKQNQGSYRKGQIPWNKGRRYHPNSQATQFKKGSVPTNSKHDGCISIRKDSRGVRYKYVRIAPGNWQYLHRELWRRKWGDIPKGMVLIFKDGDSMNVRLSNLSLITRAENLRRNENRKKAAETMRRRNEEDRIRMKYGRPPQRQNAKAFRHY